MRSNSYKLIWMVKIAPINNLEQDPGRYKKSIHTDTPFKNRKKKKLLGSLVIAKSEAQPSLLAERRK